MPALFAVAFVAQQPRLVVGVPDLQVESVGVKIPARRLLPLDLLACEHVPASRPPNLSAVRSGPRISRRLTPDNVGRWRAVVKGAGGEIPLKNRHNGGQCRTVSGARSFGPPFRQQTVHSPRLCLAILPYSTRRCPTSARTPTPAANSFRKRPSLPRASLRSHGSGVRFLVGTEIESSRGHSHCLPRISRSSRKPCPMPIWAGYFRMQSPMMPVAEPHLAPAAAP